MRIERVAACLLVGFSLMATGALLYMFEVGGKWGLLLAIMGFVFFAIGVKLGTAHTRRMDKRTRTGRE